MTTETTDARRAGTDLAPIEDVLRNTETAVIELVHGSVRVTRTLLPDVVVRPTVTVERVFDVAERLLASSRRSAHTLASFVESGFDGAERWAA
ncbi:hypothetical protein [Spirillospora sp. CA-294931]|uniref:hypothetical protein n=1 Tax=Spirillospora sp. CA-294931 TaxID=3240042 RepID=UPI003D940DB1